jgi:peptide/nickel transport system substrate-binding protein
MIIGRRDLPQNIDPALLENTNDYELVLNVYEPLIFYDRERINSFVPRLATAWNVSADGLEYTFVIRQGIKFHNNDTLTTEDVEYTFERILVLDIKWPASIFYDALFGLAGSRDDYGNIIVNASMLDGAVTRTDATVTFHLSRPYGPFLQVLSVFGFIVNKDWCIAHGEWPGTWENWTLYNRPENSKINMMNTEPPGPHIDAMCGTGPFILDYYERGVNYSLIKFDDYWGGWPAPGANGYLQRVTVMGIPDWETRRDLFLSGELDSLEVPQMSIGELLGQPGVRCVYPLPQLVCEAMFFTFNISTTSPYLGVPGGLPPRTFNESGIPPDFFVDINVRKGFAYAFNYTKLIKDVLLGDALQPATPIIPCLPFYNPAQEKYTFNLTEAEKYFRNAWNGQVWANGFNLTILYNRGNIIRLRECEILKENIEALNAKFHVQIQGLPWSELRPLYLMHEAPMFIVGWLADFADPHNFAYGFMRSGISETFPAWQNYRNGTIDELVDFGIATTNETLRKKTYYELQRLYFEDCPAVPLYQPFGRRFEREWVQGWYYNTVIGSYGVNYFYVQWKEYIPSIPITAGENIVDAVSTADTMVFINTTSPGNITIKSYDINLEGTIEVGIEVHYVKCVTIDTDLPPENISFPIEIRIYYTDQEVISAYVDQSTLRMYYWNGTKWILENDTGTVTPSDVPGYTGYVWAKIYHLSLFAIMGQLPPEIYSLTIATTTGGTTNPAPGTYTYTANSTVQVTAIPYANYLFDHWELDNVNVGSANPYITTMNKNHTLKAFFTYSPPPPPLSVSITPLSASILVGQKVTFTSTVSGGYTPYNYQWYLNGNPVSGAISNTWTFQPTTDGIYYIYLKVIDNKGNIAQSDPARITVASVPVGGFSIPTQTNEKTEPTLHYVVLTAIFTLALTIIKRKTKRLP